ncbi:MAG: hypothetical protein ACO33H_06705 [Ilumatobacteraceae bacterium]
MDRDYDDIIDNNRRSGYHNIHIDDDNHDHDNDHDNHHCCADDDHHHNYDNNHHVDNVDGSPWIGGYQLVVDLGIPKPRQSRSTIYAHREHFLRSSDEHECATLLPKHVLHGAIDAVD